MSKIPWSHIIPTDLEKKLLLKAINSGWYSDGYYLRKFESKLKNFLDCKFFMTVNNCTSAIQLLFYFLKFKKNDEIIFPGYGYMAGPNIALQMGLKPVFVDVDLKTFCINKNLIQNKISNRTKAIFLIHTYGNPCSMKSIVSIARDNNLYVIEDCAESFGSIYNKKKTGSLGDFGLFSFQSTKTITSGEGGGISINTNKTDYEKLLCLRTHGVKQKRYYHVNLSGNYRFTNIQASIAYAQFRNFKNIASKRNKIEKIYKNFFKNKIGISFQEREKKNKIIPWTLPIVLSKKKFLKRDKIILNLKKKNIEVRNGFYSPNQLPIYKKIDTNNLKNSDFLSRQILCLPFYIGLKISDIKKVCNTLLSFTILKKK